MELLGRIPPAAFWDKLGLSNSLEPYLDWLDRRGVRGVVWIPEPSLLRDVVSALERRRLALWVILPDMAVYARDAMDLGPVGAVLKRWRALSFRDRVRFLLNSAPYAAGALKREFTAGLLLLLEAEFLRMSSYPVGEVILYGSVVDMALALGCDEVFTVFDQWARSHRLAPHFLTYNFGLFDSKIREWRKNNVTVITPLNPKGYLMHPDRPAVEKLCGAWGSRLVGVDIEAGETVSIEDALSYLKNLGVQRAVLSWKGFNKESPQEGVERWRRKVKNIPSSVDFRTF